MTGKTIQIQPIGKVIVSKGKTVLKIEKKFTPALLGLEGFSHALVLWWANRADTPEQRGILQCDKPYTKAPAKLGIFATRSEYRPNPVAVSIAAILQIDLEEGTVILPWIDAEDGTPILDIKPYQPCADRVRSVSVPEWCRHWPQWYEDSAEFDWESEFLFPQ